MIIVVISMGFVSTFYRTVDDDSGLMCWNPLSVNRVVRIFSQCHHNSIGPVSYPQMVVVILTV